MIRKEKLQPLVEYVLDKSQKGEKVNLNFICTHNSRRSHLAQIWAQVAAQEYGLHHVYCYSGGTEATAVYPMVLETLEGQGVLNTKLSEDKNPLYAIKNNPDAFPILAFSKKYDHPVNPSKSFAAIMTCSDADENCPLILGAEIRVPVTYEDPKVSDGTVEQSKVYLERSEQIKAEMFYLFEKVNEELQK